MKIMKFIVIITAIISLQSYAHSSGPGTLRTSLVEGEVLLKTYGSDEWISAGMNMPLLEGDELNVLEPGRIEIQTSDGSFIRVKGGSRIIIDRADGEAVHLYLMEGDAYINFIGTGHGVLNVETPSAAVSAYENARYRIYIPGRHLLEISVFSGNVFADEGGEAISITAGAKLRIGRDRYAGLSPLGDL